DTQHPPGRHRIRGPVRSRLRGAPLRARAARPRPRHPHLGRTAALELPALAVGVRRARLRRHTVARFRRGTAARGSRRVHEQSSSVRGEMNPIVSRVLVVAILLPIVIGLVYLGGWWLFGLALVGGLLALHELYVMARALRPLVLGGYLGFVLTLLG